MSKSNWTLRHPRTLDQAFGAGTSRNFAEPEQTGWSTEDVVITVIGAVGVVVMITLSFMGVL